MKSSEKQIHEAADKGITEGLNYIINRKAIWNLYKDFIAWVVLFYFILFFVVGGEFHASIKIQNIIDLIQSIKNHSK